MFSELIGIAIATLKLQSSSNMQPEQRFILSVLCRIRWYDHVYFTEFISQYIGFVCSVNKLLGLTGSNCHITGCDRNCSVTYWISGCYLVIKGLCSVGHVFTQTSSDIPLCNRCGDKIFINDLDLASPTVVLGNNFSKTHMLFHFLQMPMFFLTTFHACLYTYLAQDQITTIKPNK